MSAAATPGWFRDTAGLYARVFRRGAGLALRNWPVALVLFGFDKLRDVLDGLITTLGRGPLSLVGGRWLKTYLHSHWNAVSSRCIPGTLPHVRALPPE